MSLTYSFNNRGEVLEHCSDGITLNFSYWECSCPGDLSNWIHHYDIEECPKCNALQEEHPNAYAEEVEMMLEEIA
jgi:hypothetical protein